MGLSFSDKKQPVPGNPEVRLRDIVPIDTRAILAIEEESFSEPWLPGEFLEFLRQKGHYGLVADILPYNPTVAYLLFSRDEKNGYDLTIANMAVNRQYRRLGLASRLISILVHAILQGGKKGRIITEVGDTNHVAHLFLAANGFRAVRMVRNGFRYENGDTEDLYRFVWRPRRSSIGRDGRRAA